MLPFGIIHIKLFFKQNKAFEASRNTKIMILILHLILIPILFLIPILIMFEHIFFLNFEPSSFEVKTKKKVV